MGVLTPKPLSLDTLVGLARRNRTQDGPQRLAVPAGMTAPLGCDAVAMPAVYGRRVLARLPRVGCVYGDGVHLWLIVPSDSDVALEWPAPAQYATGAVLPGPGRPPGLLHRPEGTVPYTPPIPLYLALCGVTGTTPPWSRSVAA